VVIKPVSEGSSIGISIMESDGEVKKGIEKAFEFDESSG
jgi:D-alanine-D-alanine ligase-like ATP-grasp enzyme